MTKLPVTSIEAAEWLRENGAQWLSGYVPGDEAKRDSLTFVLSVLLTNAVPAFPGDGTATLANLIATLMEDNDRQRARLNNLLQANNDLVERERAAKREAAGWRSVVEDVAKGEARRPADAEDTAIRLLRELLWFAIRKTGSKSIEITYNDAARLGPPGNVIIQGEIDEMGQESRRLIAMPPRSDAVSGT